MLVWVCVESVLGIHATTTQLIYTRIQMRRIANRVFIFILTEKRISGCDYDICHMTQASAVLHDVSPIYYGQCLYIGFSQT
jgi:hypothetical protein